MTNGIEFDDTSRAYVFLDRALKRPRPQAIAEAVYEAAIAGVPNPQQP